jgi:hypothetical protein
MLEAVLLAICAQSYMVGQGALRHRGFGRADDCFLALIARSSLNWPQPKTLLKLPGLVI